MSFIKNILDKWSCKHKYKEISESKTFEDEISKRPFKIIKTFLCSECGKFKKINIL